MGSAVNYILCAGKWCDTCNLCQITFWGCESVCVISAGADTGDLIETFFFSSKADGMASCVMFFNVSF